MLSALPPSVHRIVWGFLDDEEREFIQLCDVCDTGLPVERLDLKSDESKNAAKRRITLFAAENGWLDAILELKIDVALAAVAVEGAGIGGRMEILTYVLQNFRDAVDFGPGVATAARNGRCSVLRMLINHAEAYVLRHALGCAAAGGHTDALQLLKPFKTELSLDHAFLLACYEGRSETMKLLRSWGADAERFDNFCAAARGGHNQALFLLKKWGARGFSAALDSAAGYGQIYSMRLLRDWGAEVSETTLRRAVDGNGDADAFRLAVEWSNGSFDLAPYFVYAAACGRIAILRFLKSIVANPELNRALRGVAMCGRGVGMFMVPARAIELLCLLKEWGATDFNGAFLNVAACGTTEMLLMLKEWGADNFDEALARAAKAGKTDMVRILKDFGATHFRQALEAMGWRVHTEITPLLGEWIADQKKKAP